LSALAPRQAAPPSVKTATRRDLGRGGTTLWRHEGDGFSVVVFQLHDEPFAKWGLNDDDWDMIELRVLSARTDLKHFWDRDVDRVTHWKKSWSLYNMDPSKTRKDILGEGSMGAVTWSWYDFDRYEEEVEKAITNAEKTVKDLETLKKRIAGSHEPWAAALKLDTGDPNKDRFWVVAVYPDDFHWVVRIHRGMLKTFGYVYPRYWENGYRFDSFSKADAFAKKKQSKQVADGYAEITDSKTKRILKWSLREAEEADDADGGS